MSEDLDKIIKDANKLRKKIAPDLKALDGLYSKLKEEIGDKFKEEFSFQKGDLRGLEDFYSLLMIVKKDTAMIRNVSNMFRRLNDLSDYNVSEEKAEELIEKSELKEIFDKN